MNSLQNTDVARISSFVRELKGFSLQARIGACYSHMGATICDAILQAGLNYKTVVAPRVQRVLHRWSTATTTTKFLALILRHGLNGVLNWRDSEKPVRIGRLTQFLRQEQVDTEAELSDWLSSDRNGQRLRELKGVGPKTVDYLKTLVGISTIAVDRHVRTFVQWAGVDLTGYDEIREVVGMAADVLQIERRAFDHAIWSFVSTTRIHAA